MSYQWLCCVAVVVASLLPSLAQAQDDVDLIVMVRDTAGSGVANLQVVVRDQTGERDLARADTDADGVAGIRGIVVSSIRIGVSGTTPNGKSILLRGDDVQGIRVFLGVGTTQIDLRVEDDGTVITDPSEIVQEVTQAEYTPLITTSSPTSGSVVPVSVQSRFVPTSTLEPRGSAVVSAQGSGLWPFLLMAVFAGLIIAVVVVGRRV